MMNHLTGIKMDNLVPAHISLLYGQRHVEGLLSHFAERCWGTKLFSMLKMGYEILSRCVKVSFALVPRIKYDCSLLFVRK